MATRRMFSRKITESDAFLDMPTSAQCLYFHINMSADDDGFVGNVKTIKRMVGSSDDDLKLLMAKEFLIPFESGVVVIRDWKIHNYIQKDRYHETFYKSEKSELIECENKQYQRLEPVDIECIQNVSKMDTQVRLGKNKVRLGKESINTATDVASQASKGAKKEYEEEFEQLWAAYPNKKGKKDARRHYLTARKNNKVTFDELDKALKDYKIHLEKNRWKQAMNGSTWFNGRYEDSYEEDQPQVKDWSDYDFDS